MKAKPTSGSSRAAFNRFTSLSKQKEVKAATHLLLFLLQTQPSDEAQDLNTHWRHALLLMHKQKKHALRSPIQSALFGNETADLKLTASPNQSIYNRKKQYLLFYFLSSVVSSRNELTRHKTPQYLQLLYLIISLFV